MLSPSLPVVATFSIAAFDPETGSLGVAVASKFPAAGSVVPWVKSGLCAVATQSYANTSFGPGAFELITAGKSAREALDALLSADQDASARQVGIVDFHGQSATYTGSGCHAWAGGKTGQNYATQGNILTGPETIEAMSSVYESSTAAFPERMVEALFAGDRAGGDRRGRQSAALYIARDGAGYGGYNDRWIDYRVDDHPDPVPRLQELLTLHRLYFDHSDPSERIQLEGQVLQDLSEILTVNSPSSTDTGQSGIPGPAALNELIGNENFEERASVEEGWIDRPVYQYLLKKYLNR